MQENTNNFSNMINSPEFKRRSTNAVEDLAKFSFKWFGIILKSVYDFLKSMISMTIGK